MTMTRTATASRTMTMTRPQQSSRSYASKHSAARKRHHSSDEEDEEDETEEQPPKKKKKKTKLRPVHVASHTLPRRADAARQAWKQAAAAEEATRRRIWQNGDTGGARCALFPSRTAGNRTAVHGGPGDPEGPRPSRGSVALPRPRRGPLAVRGAPGAPGPSPPGHGSEGSEDSSASGSDYSDSESDSESDRQQPVAGSQDAAASETPAAHVNDQPPHSTHPSSTITSTANAAADTHGPIPSLNNSSPVHASHSLGAGLTSTASNELAGQCAFEKWRAGWTSSLETLKDDVGSWGAGRVSARKSLLALHHSLQEVKCECSHRIAHITLAVDVLVAFSDVMQHNISGVFMASLVRALDTVDAHVRDVKVQH